VGVGIAAGDALGTSAGRSVATGGDVDGAGGLDAAGVVLRPVVGEALIAGVAGTVAAG
jgi:hypothetical protein